MADVRGKNNYKIVLLGEGDPHFAHSLGLLTKSCRSCWKDIARFEIREQHLLGQAADHHPSIISQQANKYRR